MLMKQVLVGDIGGTHSRFALSQSGGGPHEARTFDNDEVGSLEAAIGQYLKDTGAHPTAAVLAVAAPVRGRDIAMTNREWRFNLDDLKTRFGLGRVRAINDFE